MDTQTFYLQDFVAKTDKSTIAYYNKVIDTFKNLDLPTQNGNWVLFGGFIRDIIAGLPYEELIKKDVDVYFIYKQGSLPNVSAHEKAYAILDSLVTKPNVEIINYNKVSSENIPFTSYALAKVKYDGIVFDIGIQCNDGRFSSNFDFRCNSLYCSFNDGVLKQRLSSNIFKDIEELSVDKCVDDIMNKKLVSIVGLLKPCYQQYCYIYHLKHRRTKMISYGYQPNLADDEIIANIYANRFKTIKNSLGNTFKEVEEQHGKLKTTLKRLKRLNNERSDLIKRLSEEDRRDIYKHDQIITLLFGLNIREELIRQDIKNQIASMKFDQYSFKSSIDDIVKIADDLIS
jgi:hypothetical protein